MKSPLCLCDKLHLFCSSDNSRSNIGLLIIVENPLKPHCRYTEQGEIGTRQHNSHTWILMRTIKNLVRSIKCIWITLISWSLLLCEGKSSEYSSEKRTCRLADKESRTCYYHKISIINDICYQACLQMVWCHGDILVFGCLCCESTCSGFLPWSILNNNKNKNTTLDIQQSLTSYLELCLCNLLWSVCLLSWELFQRTQFNYKHRCK